MNEQKPRYKCMACGTIWNEHQINTTWDKRLKCGDFMCAANVTRLKPQEAEAEEVEVGDGTTRVVKLLEKVALNWPKSLWIYTADGRLYVMRKDEAGQHAVTDFGGVDQDYIVAEIDIDSSGGDW